MTGADTPPARSRRRPPPIGRGDALFLDIDGTLVDIAPRPHDVRLDDGLIAQILSLRHSLDGALALVTGRSILDVDTLFRPHAFPIAGQHGCERRDASGTVHIRSPDSSVLARIRNLFVAFGQRHPGVVVEFKGFSLSLHYREVPRLAGHVHRTARRLLSEVPDATYELQRGKCLVEIRPGEIDKGTAIAEFLRESPFSGLRPIFVGDDRGDESGFLAVIHAGGVAIKVGSGTTSAPWRLANSDAVREWIARSAGALEQRT